MKPPSKFNNGLYVYTQLPSARHIRVIHLLPARTIYDPIRVRLSDICLNEQQPAAYAALSYVWGSPTGDRPIYCNESGSVTELDKHGIVLVTTNCEAALRHLRKYRRHDWFLPKNDPKKEVVLWIDAICINQQDMQERIAQVKLMGDVYTSASKVLVWLGYGDWRLEKRTKRAARKLKVAILVDKVLKAEGLDPNQIVGVDERTSMQELRWSAWTFVKKCLESDSLHTLDLASHEYWNRVWTVQEFILAERPVIIYEFAILPYSSLCILHPRRDDATSFNFRRNLRSEFYNEDLKVHDTKKPTSLSITLVNSLQSNIATNPFDRIIGYHSLLRKYNVAFEPDYTTPLPVLCTIYTGALIAAAGKLWPLYFVRRSSHQPTGFSWWVPDWTTVSAFSSKRYDEDKVIKMKMVKEGGITAFASKSAKVDAALLGTSSGAMLKLRGIKIGDVEKVMSPVPRFLPRRATGNLQVVRAVYRQWRNFCLALDAGLAGEVPCASHRMYHLAFASLYSEFCGTDTTKFLAEDSFLMRLSDGDPANLRGDVMDRFAEYFQGLMLFHIGSGHLGLIDGRLNVGDVVVLLSGGDAPVILCADGTSYRYKDVAWVAGVMEGEAWPDEVSVEDLEIFTVI